MIEVNEQLAEVISNSRVAFINGQMAEAFKLAKEAIKLDENCADAYQCAANVCMSLSRYEDAIEYYQKAVNCDPNGIDGVYKNKDPNGDPKFIIAEAKYGSSQLGNTKKSGPQMGDKWIKNNIGKIVDDPDDIIEGLATGDTVKELFRVNVSNDNGLVNVTTSVKSLK